MSTFKGARFNPKTEGQTKSDGSASAERSEAVSVNEQAIPLGDLTSPEMEFSRLRAALTAVETEVTRLRGENAKLASTCEGLHSQLRDLKLIVSKTYVNEMRALERGGSLLSRLFSK